MKLVIIFSLLITQAFAQTRQQIVDEASKLIDNANYSNADQRTLSRALNLVQRANLLLDNGDTRPDTGKVCTISGSNNWVYIDVNGTRAHSIYNNGTEVLAKVRALGCKRHSINVTVFASTQWNYLKVGDTNIFSFYNSGDLLMSALESIQTIDAFNIDIQEATLTSNNNWVYLKLSGHSIFSFYNSPDQAILKIEQYPILKNLMRRNRHQCSIQQSNGWSYVYFDQSAIYSYYNNWSQAEQKLNYLIALGICLR